MENDLDNLILYSATSSENLESILKNGMRAGSYWTSDKDVVAYYAETIEDEGDKPVIIQVNLSDLQLEHIGPDRKGIEEPLTYTLGISEEEVESVWDNSEQTWKDSLAIIHSLRYADVIPSNFLTVQDSKLASNLRPRP